MKIKTLLAGLVLSLAPAIAFAACGHESAQQAMSCAEGSTWDSESATCVPVVSS